ncbi:MAG: putative metal-dependent hydrolase YcfH [Acidimicrobiales bacterium]|nr:MAG: TatD family deoxyribonuclease [Actinomycetota bacterium]MBV6507793.1 putative metal-dependent hydrolase YcfH [Acidimicrobiales bacterium]RIK05951.1 MAG: hypothetical protein DCC48_08305 [Acidobacteriota bacterium]
MAARWIDNHCHLDSGEDARAQVEEARAHGVLRLINVGTTAEHSRLCITTAAELEEVWATAGVHPHDATEGSAGIAALLDLPRVVAVGECGLDYHYNHSPPEVQRRVFAEQIRFAHERGLPLVIHSREAWPDTFAILEAEGYPRRTVFHCFSGGPGEAETALSAGAWLSFSGIITFPGADDLRAAATVCPLDRMMVETDSPYLAPVPHRGRTNRPAWVPAVGAGLATAKSVEVDEIAEATWSTASAFYGLD